MTDEFVVDSLVAAAESALRAGRWQEAREAFLAVIEITDDPADYDGLAQVAWWLDDADAALGAREAAYRGYREAADLRAAARAAASLGYDSVLFGRGLAVGRGWLARADDLLRETPAAVEVGWLELRRAELILNAEHDPRAGLVHAEAAHRIGRDSGATDLDLAGQALAGLAKVHLGDVHAGMAMLDGTAAAATAGDLDDLMWTGKSLCWLISACQAAGDLSRAASWCDRVTDLSVRRELAPLFTACRTQYASVLLAQGQCAEAEDVLADLVQRTSQSRRISGLDVVTQLGELRRRQGRYDEAEALLARAEFETESTIARARLRLDRGEPEPAWELVARLLTTVPADQQLARARVLSVAVPTAMAVDQKQEATKYADELRSIAGAVPTDSLHAAAAAAAAWVTDGRERVDRWTDAVRHAARAGLRFDEADYRLELASAHAATGSLEASRDQARRAAELLVAVPTSPGYRRACHLAGSGAAPLTARQQQVLQLLAQGLSNDQIARALVVSPHTVHRHVANIFQALGVGSRAAAAAYAVRSGLL